MAFLNPTERSGTVSSPTAWKVGFPWGPGSMSQRSRECDHRNDVIIFGAR